MDKVHSIAIDSFHKWFWERYTWLVLFWHQIDKAEQE